MQNNGADFYRIMTQPHKLDATKWVKKKRKKMGNKESKIKSLTGSRKWLITIIN